MAKGIGIDAVEIERIRSARERLGEAFERRVLSDGERSLLAASSTPDMFMAGRFAAKEAVMKVLGTGWSRGVRWVDIEVTRERMYIDAMESVMSNTEIPQPCFGTNAWEMVVTIRRQLPFAGSALPIS